MTSLKAQILLVEDEPAQREVLRYNLESEGFTVRCAENGEEALLMIAEALPDLVILDWMMPLLSGIEVCRRIKSRDETRHIPIIMLSARSEEVDTVRGLETGADDYVIKPYSVSELMARVRSQLRRSRPVGPPTLTFGGYFVDRAARSITKDGEELVLRPKEFDLLVHMASRPGEVMTRSDLLRDVWGSSPDWQDPGTVTVHVRRLRRLIEADAASPDHIVTVYGVGYRFDQ